MTTDGRLRVKRSSRCHDPISSEEELFYENKRGHETAAARLSLSLVQLFLRSRSFSPLSRLFLTLRKLRRNGGFLPDIFLAAPTVQNESPFPLMEQEFIHRASFLLFTDAFA